MNQITVINGIIIEENSLFTLSELSQACGQPAEWIVALVEEGVIEPEGENQRGWRFRGHCLRRVRIVQRLEFDLGVNLAGAALVLDLLEEVEALRQQLASLQP